jgi:hypothetical protein
MKDFLTGAAIGALLVPPVDQDKMVREGLEKMRNPEGRVAPADLAAQLQAAIHKCDELRKNAASFEAQRDAYQALATALVKDAGTPAVPGRVPLAHPDSRPARARLLDEETENALCRIESELFGRTGVVERLPKRV